MSHVLSKSIYIFKSVPFKSEFWKVVEIITEIWDLKNSFAHIIFN